jgi:hypothetical protein
VAWAEVEAIDSGRWAGYWFRLTFDRGAVVSFEVNRAADAPLLTARGLQDVPYKSIEDTARACITGRVDQWLAGRSERVSDRAERRWLDEFAATDRRTERGLWLAGFASMYVETIGTANQRETLASLAEVSLDYVSELVQEARQRELLSPTTQGRAGGQLTAKAISLLSGMSPTKILMEKLCWTESVAQEMVNELEQSGDLDWALAGIASRAAPDPEVFARAHKESAERDQRFRDLHAQLDSGEITPAEWSRRVLSNGEGYNP